MLSPEKYSQFLSETTILYQLLTCVFFCEFSRVFHPIGAPSPMISHRSQDSGASLAVEFSSCWNACKAWVTDFSAHGNNMEHIVDSKIVLCLSTFELVEKHRSNLKLNLLLVFIRNRKRWNRSKMFKARLRRCSSWKPQCFEMAMAVWICMGKGRSSRIC